MPLDVISSEIISACLKRYGHGELFFRRDGLEFEDRRAAMRQAYLETHRELKDEYQQSIARAAITPGMTKPDVIAAWGLLEEDTRMAFGHVVDDSRAVYAYFTGFTVGERYALYFKDDVVVGVSQTDVLVPPHEQELEMRLTEEYRGLITFYGDEHLTGTDGHHFDVNWIRDSPPFPARWTEPVEPWTVTMIEQHLKAKGLFGEYMATLRRLNPESENFSTAQCSRAALEVLPYPPLLRAPDDPHITLYPLEPRAATGGPPEEWFWHMAAHRPSQVALIDVNGQIEFVNAEWIKTRLFVVGQVPLLVNGVTQFDQIEVEWLSGDPIPHFQRVVKNIGYRTVRVTVAPNFREYLANFVRDYIEKPYAGRYSHENNVLAFTIAESRLSETLQRQLWYSGITWIHTDTLTHE